MGRTTLVVDAARPAVSDPSHVTPALHGIGRKPALVRAVRRAGGAGARARPAVPRTPRRQRKPLWTVAQSAHRYARRRRRQLDVCRSRELRAARGARAVPWRRPRQHRRRRRHRRTARTRGEARRRAGRGRRHLRRYLPDLQFPRCRRRRAPRARSLSRRYAGHRGAARGGGARGCAHPLPLQSRQSDGLVLGRRCAARAHRQPSRRRAAAAR